MTATPEVLGETPSVGSELPNEPNCEVPDADSLLPEVPESDTETDDCGRPASRARTVAKVVVPLLIGAATVYVLIGSVGDAHGFARALRSVNPFLLAAALACEAMSFLFLGLHLRLLAGPEANVRRLAPFRIGLVVFGLGSIMPAAPAEGLVLAGAALKHRRLNRRRSVLVLGVSQFFGTTGLYALAAIDAVVVVLMAHDGPFPRWLLIGGGAGMLVVLIGLALVLTRACFAGFIGLLGGRIRHPVHPASANERRDRGIAWHDATLHVISDGYRTPQLIGSILLGWALDGSCLFFALGAVGVHVNLDVLLLAYSVGAAASVIPFLPAGLGIVEAITPAVLALYGVPIEAALAGILVYRALATLLPALVGAGALATLRLQKPPPAENKDSPAVPALTN